MAKAYLYSTSDTVIYFMKTEVLYQFWPPRIIISDNATCFTTKKLQKFMKVNGTTWKTVLEYAPISNGRAERMVGTLKSAVKSWS